MRRGTGPRGVTAPPGTRPVGALALAVLGLAIAIPASAQPNASSRPPDAAGRTDTATDSDPDSDADSVSDQPPDVLRDTLTDAPAPEPIPFTEPSAAASSTVASDPASTPEAPSPALRLEAPSLAPPITGTWVLDDGRGAEVPWDDFDPAEHYAPRGQVHFGAQLRGAGLIGAEYPIPAGPLFEAALFFDLRYSQRSPWRLRILAAMTLQTTGKAYGASGDQSNAFSMRLRVMPLAIDLGEWITVRFGGGLSLFWAELARGGAFQVYPDMTGEIVTRVFDGRLELGVFAGLHFTAVTHPFGAGGHSQTALGVSAGYIIQ